MVIAYASMTGNTVRFVNRLKEKLPNHKFQRITRQAKIDEPFVLITFTINFGRIPIQTQELLDSSAHNLVAVVGNGNRNWGEYYCLGAKTIAKEYNVPLLHTFELSGYNSDVEIVAQKIKELEEGKGSIGKKMD